MWWLLSLLLLFLLLVFVKMALLMILFLSLVLSHDNEAPPSDQLRPDFTYELEVSVVRHVVPAVLRVPREGDTCLPVRLVLRRVPVKVGQSLVIVVHPRVLLGVVAGDADLIMVRQTWTQGVCENEIIEKQTVDLLQVYLAMHLYSFLKNLLWLSTFRLCWINVHQSNGEKRYLRPKLNKLKLR